MKGISQVWKRPLQLWKQRLKNLPAGLEELEKEILGAASNYTRLNELMKEKTEKEAQLEEKMDRWMYLTDLVEQIENQK